jgi:dihydrodipicolinate reductase
LATSSAASFIVAQDSSGGALKAALWARGQKPGLYSMADVLGLKDF